MSRLKKYFTDNRERLEKYADYISGIFFFVGFVFDYFTVSSILSPWATYISLAYFLGVAILIYLKELYFRGNVFFDFVISFLLGSYASMVFIYYIRGGDLIVNLPILFAIGAFMFANEFLKKKYRLMVELATFGVTTIFYFIFITPIIMKGVGDRQFYVAISIAFVFLFFYLYFLYRVSKEEKKFKIHYFLTIPILLLGLAFYLKVLPAVPLNLHYSGFYKNISSEIIEGEKYYTYDGKINRNFDVQNFDSSTFLQRVVVPTSSEERLYFYSEIEAPIDFNFNVTHRWQYYNENKKAWQTVSEVTYPVSGGRVGGYRGYTYITNLQKGKYKVSVLVNGDRYIGSSSIVVK